MATALLVVVGGFLMVRNERERRSRTVDTTVGFSQAAARSADQVLRDNVALLELLATSPVLEDGRPDEVQAVLDAIDVRAAGYQQVGWIDRRGRLMAATDRNPGAPVKDLSRLDYVRAVLQRGEPAYVSEVTPVGRDGTRSVVLSVPARGPDGGVIGLVAGSFSLDRVARHLTGFRFGGSDLIVLDRDDRVVIAGDVENDPAVDASRDPAVRRLRAGASTVVNATDPLGRTDRLVTGAETPNGDWLVMVSRSAEDAFGSDRRNLNLELGGLLVAALAVMAIAWRGAVQIDSLQDLAQAAAETERRTSERSASLRLALAEVAQAPSRQEAADNVVASGMEALGARAGSVVLREDDAPDALRIMAHRGYPEAQVRVWNRHPVAAPTLTGRAVRTGRAVFVDPDGLVGDFPELAPQLLAAGDRSWASLPLRAGREVIGAITMSFRDDSAMRPSRQLEMATYAAEAGAAFATARTREVEHEFALALQRDLLPEALPSTGGMTVHAEYLPANSVLEVGGDWYDVVERPDGAVMLVVGDVVGHGVSAIAAMGQLSSVCRAMADEASPAQVLDSLDRLARRVDRAAGSTAVCVLLDPARRELRYAVAGHPRPILLDGGVVRELDDAVSLPLSYDDRVRPEATVPLVGPTTLVLFSDGLVERRDASYADRVVRLREVVAATEAGDLCATILREMGVGDDGDDDTVVMVVHVP